MPIKKHFSDAESVYAHRLEKAITSIEKMSAEPERFDLYLEMAIKEKEKCKQRLLVLREAIDQPISVGKKWLYQDAVYEVIGNYTDSEKKLMLLEYADKERQKFERLAAKFSGDQSDSVKYERTRIPEQVRIEVWRRDQGKCVSCGSREKLEYDHIVPVSRGGSNTARNVELLCQDCNRAKGDRIQ
jgi:hypothetical protein